MLCSVADTVFAVGCPAFWIISAMGAQPVKINAKTITDRFIRNLRTEFSEPFFHPSCAVGSADNEDEINWKFLARWLPPSKVSVICRGSGIQAGWRPSLLSW